MFKLFVLTIGLLLRCPSTDNDTLKTIKTIFHSTKIFADSIRVSYSVPFPGVVQDTIMSQRGDNISFLVFQNGTSRVLALNEAKVSPCFSSEFFTDLFLEYLPFVYHRFQEYAESSKVQKGFSYRVPFIIKRVQIDKPKCLEENAGALNRQLHQISKRIYHRSILDSRFKDAHPKVSKALVDYMIECIPEQSLQVSDSVLFVVLVSSDKAYQYGQEAYVCLLPAGDCFGLQMDTGSGWINPIPQKYSVLRIFQAMVSNDQKVLKFPDSVSLFLDIYHFNCFLVLRDKKGQFRLEYYINTNKGLWYGMDE